VKDSGNLFNKSDKICHRNDKTRKKLAKQRLAKKEKESKNKPQKPFFKTINDKMNRLHASA